MRCSFFFSIALTVFAGCRDIQDEPRNEPPMIVAIQAPAYISANDTIFVSAYDKEGDTLVVSGRILTASGNVVGSAFTKNFSDDGLAGDHTAHDLIFTGILNRSALLAQSTSQFKCNITVAEKEKNGSSTETVIISQNPSSGHPPEISNLIAPDSVNTSQVSEFLITIQVSDPEGLSDIASVTRTTPSNLVLSLNDSGVNGDETAGDGIYSERVSVNPAPPAGSYLFTFQATDLLGLKSNIIQKTITIVH